MNPKIEKVTAEIEKTRARLIAAQERLAELEKQKTELENDEIVTQYRSVDVPPSEITAFIRAFKERGVPPASLPAREVIRNEE